ncbi:MAG: Tex-like N-terminal domain-containing protein, partial [Bacteroidia bacterium]
MQNVSGFKDWQKKAVLKLLAEGATVPFMARYRKEATGHLDEVAIIAIQEAEEAAQQLLKRKQFVLESIQEQGKLSAELEKAIRSAQTLTELEDLYLPYKARRKTRADLAREKGLEPLARGIWEQRTPYLSALLKTHLPVGMKAEEALNGARDIIAEWINEDAALRAKLRDLWAQMGFIQAKPARGKKEADEAQKFRDYFEYEEPLKRVQHHRLMAVSRGADLGMLSVKVDAPWADRVWPLLKRHCLKGYGESSDQVALAVEDAYKRLLQPSLENEWMTQARALAEEDAVSVFALNVRQLLLAAPLGEKSVLAIDPGFRTGCKVVALDAYGSLIFHSVIYPHEPQRQWETAAADLKRWAQEFGIQAIAVGNGTAGRETEDLCRDVFEPLGLEVYSVNESGASVYSASAIAREEFPHEDAPVRGAVSIGRRLQDP